MTTTTSIQGEVTVMKTEHATPRGLRAFLRYGKGASVQKGGSGSSVVATSSVRGAHRLTPKRVLSLILMLVIPLVAVLGLAVSAQGADEEDLMRFSFYKVASNTTSFFSNIQAPDSDESFSEEVWKPMLADPGTAGSLLGYADPKFSFSTSWLSSKISGSSDAIGYGTLLIRDKNGNVIDDPDQQGMANYAYFGAALQGLGIDGTSTGLSLGFINFIGGFLVMILYLLSGAVDFFFQAILGLLQMLNPFKLFYVGVNAINPKLAEGMVGGDTSDLGPLQGLAEFIGGWYEVLNNLSWEILVPLFVATFLFAIMLGKKEQRGGKIKKLLIRITFLALGLPLLGSMYTGMLNGMVGASTDAVGAGSTRVVMSTYVDFENWAMNSRMAIPSEGAIIAWDPAAEQPSNKSQSSVRNTALAINNQTHGLGLDSIVTAGSSDTGWANQAFKDGAENGNFWSNIGSAGREVNGYATTVDMLRRYMGGSQVSSAAFETAIKGQLSQSGFYSNDPGAVAKWFSDLETDDLNNDGDLLANPLIAVQPGEGLRTTAKDGVFSFTSNSTGCLTDGTKILVSDTLESRDDLRDCNLSPIALYNYLNSDFDSTSMKMYSSGNVQSEATRSIHTSVNQVGSGAMSFLYWIDAIVLLSAFVVIGAGYAFSLLFANIRRGLQLITSIPFATLGAIAAIAKVIIYSVVLILEVILTIFVYKIVQMILISLPQIVETPLAALLSNPDPTSKFLGFVVFITSGWAFGLIITLASIVTITGFTVMAMRLRKTLVKTMEEATTKLVEKFTDSAVGTPGGMGGMVPALAGGVAAGAGASAANRMMSGGKSSDKGPKAQSVTGQPGGPDQIGTQKSPFAPGGTADAGVDSVSGDGQQPQIGSGGQPLQIGMSPGGNSVEEVGIDGSTDPSSKEVELGKDVEANGLSHPAAQTPSKDGDALDAANASAQESMEGYKKSDEHKKSGAKSSAKALGHGIVAIGRGMAGDEKGAVESAGKAAEEGGKAKASAERSKQASKDAERSSLDALDNKHELKAQQADKFSSAGRSISSAAGTMDGGASGGSPQGPATPSAPPAQSGPQPKGLSVPASSSVPVSAAPTQQKAPSAPSVQSSSPQQQQPVPASSAPRKKRELKVPRGTPMS